MKAILTILCCSIVCCGFMLGCDLVSLQAQAPDAQVAQAADADTPAIAADEPALDVTPAVTEPPVFPPLPQLDKSWKRLLLEPGAEKRDRVWINGKTKQVAIDGQVCLTQGYLEMFACTGGLKAHESVVGLQTKAYVVHAALIAIGAKPGSPATWRPAYQPAHGTRIDVIVEWRDAKTQKLRRTPAQQWVRDLKTKQALASHWVFGGSSFWKDPGTGKEYYRAEGGDLICVSNFPTATMDLPIESSQANDDLAYEVFTENVPPLRTPVRIYLSAHKEKKQPAPAKLQPDSQPAN